MSNLLADFLAMCHYLAPFASFFFLIYSLRILLLLLLYQRSLRVISTCTSYQTSMARDIS